VNSKLLITLLVTVALHFAPAAQARKRTVTLIELNDLHAHLVPHKDVVSDGSGGTRIETRGGLTRIATAVKAIRAGHPNSLLMNIGDTFHGGAEAFFTAGNAVVDPLNSLGIDVGVPGNWDFYYSPVMFRARFGRINTELFTGRFDIDIPGFALDAEIKRPNYPNLAANMKDVMERVTPRKFLEPTRMIKINKVKVGFIGLTSDIVADMHPMLAQGFDFSQGETEHKQLVDKYARKLRKDGADIVVVMSELGIHKTRRLADIVKKHSVDVFFAAHTHEVTYEPVKSASGALVVEAGNDGYLGQMDITVKQKKKKTNKGKTRKTSKVIARNWRIIEIDNSVAEDPEMKVLVDKERAGFFADDVALLAPPPFFAQTLNMPLDTVIGHTDSVIDRKNAMESTFNNGWTDLLREVTGTEVAMTPGFRIPAAVAEPGYMDEMGAIASGDITLEDAFRFFPMMYSIATGEVTGKRLKEIIEAQLVRTYSSDTFNHTGGWNYGFSGLDMTLDLAAGDGNRIQSLSYSDSGTTVRNSDRITVAGCQRMPIEFAGTLCAYSGFTSVEPYTGPFAAGDAMTALDLFVEALATRSFDGTRSSITDLSDTPVWPAATYIQPLDGAGSATPAKDGNDCGFFGPCDSGSFRDGVSIFGLGRN